MNRLFPILLIGFAISFTGTLPPGVLNVTAFNITVQEGWYQAVLFSTGATLVEMFYLLLTLYSVQWLYKRQRLLYYMQWATVCLFVIIIANSFGLTFGGTTAIATVPALQQGSRLLIGLALSAINPAQFPFWIGWNTLLFSKGTLVHNRSCYTFYIVGTGTGTLSGLGVFIAAGRLLNAHSTPSTAWINGITGAFYCVCLLMLLYKIFQKRQKPPPYAIS